jgi:hypothetical protein
LWNPAAGGPSVSVKGCTLQGELDLMCSVDQPAFRRIFVNAVMNLTLLFLIKGDLLANCKIIFLKNLQELIYLLVTFLLFCVGVKLGRSH